MESQEDTWLAVDETGHVPGVAAELPHGHKVLLDASGNIMAIVAVEAVPALEEAVAEQQQGIGSPITQLPAGTAFLVDQTLHEAQSPLEPLPVAQGTLIRTETSETPPDRQETAQPESEAITPPTSETPVLASGAQPETDAAVSAQPDEGTGAPDNVASPIAVGGTEQEETQA